MAAHQVVQEGAEAAIGGGVESITMTPRDSHPNPKLQEFIASTGAMSGPPDLTITEAVSSPDQF